MRTIGFVVNPIAGMGGPVGLKGTDGNVAEARDRGATPQSPMRARRALAAIAATDPSVHMTTWGSPMGEALLRETDLPVTVLGGPSGEETSAADTRSAIRAFIEADVDMILFVGGDGTAVDVATVVADEAPNLPILGVPAGVKIFSSVFGVNPEAAGRVAATFQRTEQREVADIDEDAYREGEVRSAVKAVIHVPVDDEVQLGKQSLGGSIEGLIAGVLSSMQSETTYFLGPGGTVGAIKDALDIDGTPLGIDVWRDGEVLEVDAAATDLEEYLSGPTTIIVSPIGGQGFVFGRGNQQFTPEVIRASTCWIVASRDKLDNIGVLRVDTGDPTLDKGLRGWVKVQTGRVERRMMEIV